MLNSERQSGDSISHWRHTHAQTHTCTHTPDTHTYTHITIIIAMLLMASKDNMAAKRFSSALTKVKIVNDSLENLP